MGDWLEVLSHANGAVDASSARALLINHKSDQIAGTIEGAPTFDGSQCTMRCSLLPGAQMASGVKVADAVRSGALRGVSVGYHYNMADTTWNESTRTLTVNKWSLREASLTPIPADQNAMVRELPSLPVPQPPAATSPAVTVRKTTMSDSVAGDIPAAPAVDVAKVRADAINETREVLEMARSLNLDGSVYIGQTKVDAQSAMIRDLAKARAAAIPEPSTPAVNVSVNVDHVDKQAEAASDAICARAGFKLKLQGNPYAGKSMLDMVRSYGRAIGVRGIDDFSRKDLANHAMGYDSQIVGKRDTSPANISNASFASFVTLNAITKAVALGFEMGSSSVKYQRIVETQRVPDFKTYYVGGLGTGNLIETPESVAFPELAKSEGVYSNTAKMWGGTLSLTIQALLNDDTSSFDRSLRQTGIIAQKTIDKRVFQKLLMGTATSTTASTWTSNTTSGGTIAFTTADTKAAARQNIGKVRAAFMAKIGLDGNPGGQSGSIMLVPPTQVQGALDLVGAQTSTTASGAVDLEVITSAWLEASALTGNSSTSYYLLANPMEVTGMLLSLISGYESPQVMEMDSGAVGARKWKIWMPFEADTFYFTNAAGTAIIPGIHQATT